MWMFKFLDACYPRLLRELNLRTVQDIQTPDDLKGVKLCACLDLILVMSVDALGASATTNAFW